MMSRQKYTEGTNVNEVEDQQEGEEEAALRSEWTFKSIYCHNMSLHY